MNLRTLLSLLLLPVVMGACNAPGNQQQVPVIGFVDAFRDNTIARARQGFLDALENEGFSEKKNTIKVIYRNAQGNIPTVTQIIKYFISEKVDAIATCPTLPTIAALQNTATIPVCMMVAPEPELMKITTGGKAPANLFGVGENLGYIDTSFNMIPGLVIPKSAKLKVGVIYNQAEPQSVEALSRLKELASAAQAELVALPVNNTSEAQMVSRSLVSKGIDAFFANPDNCVFESFETILKSCNDANVPVFTSEAGLVARGAVAAYGADIYRWGYQAGEQMAAFLKNKNTKNLHWEMVKVRNRVYNPEAARRFGIRMPEDFQPIKQ